MTVAPSEIDDILHTRFGLTSFRPGQREVIDALVQRGGALAVFPTGAGKSLCYQLTALLFEGVTLVVSPLIALMKDQIDYLQRLGIAAERMDSTQSTIEAKRVAERLRSGGYFLSAASIASRACCDSVTSACFSAALTGPPRRTRCPGCR